MKDNFRFPEHPVYMNWRPADASHALGIFECGGPLVDADTGRVTILPTIEPEYWSQLANLPSWAWREGRPRGPEPTPAAPEPASYEQAARAAWSQMAVAA
jgi:hypothetical protein